MNDLSPTAQAVLDAYYCDAPVPGSKRVAAALRALADQVVPEEPEPRWGEPVRSQFNRQCIRHRFLAIATELEGQQ